MLPRLLLVLSLICHFSIAEEVEDLYVSLVPVGINPPYLKIGV